MSVEHTAFYQYAFHRAKNVHASMLQAQISYSKSAADALAARNLHLPCPENDPVGCDGTWAIRIENSSVIGIHGAGVYSHSNGLESGCGM
jgi:hypothetical protein